MDNTPMLLQLGKQLQAATVKQDWQALDVLDRKLARHLSSLAPQATWSADERAALLALRQAHMQAFQACSQEKQRLGIQLGEIHSKQEGWVAYALESDMYQDGNQA